jgi:hypothetical protein
LVARLLTDKVRQPSSIEHIGSVMTSKKVLNDHKRQGKTYIPPFTHMIGPLQEISWVKTILPELLWIALLQNHYGHRRGVELVTVLARTARKLSNSAKLQIFGAISSFKKLSDTEKDNIRNALATAGELFSIQEALFPLIVFYPDCPLHFLFSRKASSTDADLLDAALNRLKTVVADLYDKTTRDATMVQATMVWLAFDADLLKVAKHLPLAKFPEIEKYPNTELSQEIASGIRGSVHMFFVPPHYVESADWPRYFWNRGLEIDPCYFEDIPSE